MKFDLNLRTARVSRASLTAPGFAAMAAPMVCIAFGLLVSGCSHHKSDAAAAPPKFPPPTVAQKSAPDLNSVPTTVPTPPSTKDERDKALSGLVADRENARHSDQPARTMPVAVRPLSDAPPPPDAAPAAPSAVQVAAVERLETPPPSRPADVDSPTAAPAVPGTEAQVPGPQPRSGALVGPRRAPVSPLPSSGDDDSPASNSTPDTAPPPGAVYRTLTQFDSTAYKPGHLLATIDIATGSLTASERANLSTAAAKQNEVRGVVRVIGHGPTKGISQDHAVVVARELERLGVPRDQLFVGSVNETGPTEVFVHY